MSRVFHKIHGQGIILETRYNGYELLIKFNDEIDRWIFYDEVKIIDEPREEPLVGKVNKLITKNNIINGDFNSRWKIETLRLGIFPHKYIDEFTFGRTEERKYILKWLNESKKGSLILSGEYGVGKTHFLEYMKKIAIENKWAVSFLQLDKHQNPLNKPKALYKEIINGFSYINGDFKQFIKEIAASKSENYEEIKEHEHLYAVIKRLNTRKEKDTWEWIQGKFNKARIDTYCPPIYTYSTTPNVYCYILSGLSYAAKNILGLKGLLLLIDEAEYIDRTWYNSYQITKGWNFLKGLILTSNNSNLLVDENKIQVNITNKVRDELWGELSKLQYSNIYPCNYIWRTPCNLKLLLAFTPNETLFSFNPLNELDIFQLENLNKKTLQKIASEVATIYKRAYQFSTSKTIPLHLIEHINSTRLYIKSIVEILDLIRFHPSKELDVLLR